jgi:hypothetical protein
MIIRDLFFESGSTEAAKIKKNTAKVCQTTITHFITYSPNLISCGF